MTIPNSSAKSEPNTRPNPSAESEPDTRPNPSAETGPVRGGDLMQLLPTSPLAPEIFAALIELADDEFIIGHRHSEWLGLSPFLEEDLTLSSIAQDEFGHARALYRIIWPGWDTREQGLVRRPAHEWRSCSLTERQSPTWEWSLIRHAVYDTAEPHRWNHLLRTYGATINELEALVANVHQEEAFHRRHADDLVRRIGNANDDARLKLQSAVDELWPDVLTFLAGATGAQSWGDAFLVDLDRLFDEALLSRPDVTSKATSGVTSEARSNSRSVRHPDFAGISESLLVVVAFDPTASW